MFHEVRGLRYRNFSSNRLFGVFFFFHSWTFHTESDRFGPVKIAVQVVTQRMKISQHFVDTFFLKKQNRFDPYSDALSRNTSSFGQGTPRKSYGSFCFTSLFYLQVLLKQQDYKNSDCR